MPDAIQDSRRGRDQAAQLHVRCLIRVPAWTSNRLPLPKRHGVGEVSEAWKAILRPLPTFAAIGMGL